MAATRFSITSRSTSTRSLLAWLAGFPAPRWAIPSVGPSFGRAMDQARLVRRHAFRCVMMLPCGDPRDAAGMEAGLREVADACGVPLDRLLKSEDGFGSDLERGLDAVGRLVDDGVAVAIKYAVVRDDAGSRPLPGRAAAARRCEPRHQRNGRASGDRAPAGLQAGRPDHGFGMHRAAPVQRALRRGRTARTGPGRAPAANCSCRSRISAMRWGPARVLHHASELAGIAPSGPIPPFVSMLSSAAARAAGASRARTPGEERMSRPRRAADGSAQPSLVRARTTCARSAIARARSRPGSAPRTSAASRSSRF